jgi:cytosine/adenosine deaminase-related metal-dependent hydrolase
MAGNESSTWTIRARWLFPVSEPPREHGIVRVGREKIETIDEGKEISVDLDLPGCAILPGLVNAHTHLDLSRLRGPAPSPDFTSWLRSVIHHRRDQSSEQIAAAIHDGLTQSIRYGTTLLGDIAGQGMSWPALAAAPIRSLVFHEMLGLTSERAAQSREAARAWLEQHPATSNCRPGLSPHAPYSVRASLFESAAQLAREFNATLATHLAETPAELELLEARRGPFVDFLEELGVYDPDGLIANPAKVIRYCGEAAVPALLVHGNYLKPSSIIPPQCTLVYCPRTHQAFGHTPHPLREFLARGVRVALGTDSLASNPDLDVLAEARFLRQRHPDVPGDQLLRMATLSGAEALGFADETGSLEPGKSADLVVVPIGDKTPADPHDLVLRSSTPVSGVLCRGKWLRQPA